MANPNGRTASYWDKLWFNGNAHDVHITGPAPYQRQEINPPSIAVLNVSPPPPANEVAIYLKGIPPALWQFGRQVLEHGASLLLSEKKTRPYNSMNQPRPVEFETPGEPSNTGRATSHVERTQATSSVFPLMSLPDELVLEVMGHLPPASLYCLRQTSTTFMGLFDRQQFKEFHYEPDITGGHMRFNWVTSYGWDLTDIANSLHHAMYCASCLDAEESGTLAARVKELRRCRYCDGCHERHAGALFFSEDKQRHDHDSGELFCVGHLAEMAFCGNHACKPTMWRDVEEYAEEAEAKRQRGETYHLYRFSCTEQCHKAQLQGAPRKYWTLASVMPRRRLGISYSRPYSSTIYFITVGRHLPLLQIEGRSNPHLSAVQDALSNLVAEAADNRRLCPHSSVKKDLLAFVQSGICNCFTHDRGFHPDALKCDCERQTSVQCRTCGASYEWLLCKGRISLLYHYLWSFNKPSSPAWLNLLPERERQKLYGEDNRHVLWCDSPGCRTSTSDRWESLLKENAEYEYFDLPEEDRHTSDYWAMFLKSKISSYRDW